MTRLSQTWPVIANSPVDHRLAWRSRFLAFEQWIETTPRHRARARRDLRAATALLCWAFLVTHLLNAVLLPPSMTVAVVNLPTNLAAIIGVRLATHELRRRPAWIAFLVTLLAVQTKVWSGLVVPSSAPIMVSYASLITFAVCLVPWSTRLHMTWILANSIALGLALAFPFGAHPDLEVTRSLILAMVTASIASFAGHLILRNVRLSGSTSDRGRRMANDSLRVMNARLGVAARTDELTGVGSRMRLREDLATLAESEPFSEDSNGLALIMCDVDRFKLYNDRYGHQLGDEALRLVSESLVLGSRSADSVYRYGGEEFLVVLEGVSAHEAEAVGDRMRETVRKRAIAHAGNAPSMVVTVSVGVASTTLKAPAIGELLRAADRALFVAKASGRDRTVVAPFGCSADGDLNVARTFL